ncbi:hypothetical protein [Metasolibacillus sp.]|uniref:hypothetical protein n=1 Tax=Metasolibacillus sp. TaxID=2703680 RepID=UPI0025CC6E5F|nr:hypothetical protein [Metasolibacillus sp.]MCT6926340.1 hypothetical protein [Metasolibacillus sp.]
MNSVTYDGKAYDCNGQELERGDIVKIITDRFKGWHGWLRKGNALKVAYWENRPIGMNERYVVIFLKTKGFEPKYVQAGVLENDIEIVKKGARK